MTGKSTGPRSSPASGQHRGQGIAVGWAAGSIPIRSASIAAASAMTGARTVPYPDTRPRAIAVRAPDPIGTAKSAMIGVEPAVFGHDDPMGTEPDGAAIGDAGVGMDPGGGADVEG